MRSLLLFCVGLSMALALTAGTAWGEPASLTGLEPENQLTADRLASWVLEANPGLAAVQAAAEAAAYRIDPAGPLHRG